MVESQDPSPLGGFLASDGTHEHSGTAHHKVCEPSWVQVVAPAHIFSSLFPRFVSSVATLESMVFCYRVDNCHYLCT